MLKKKLPMVTIFVYIVTYIYHLPLANGTMVNGKNSTMVNGKNTSTNTCDYRSKDAMACSQAGRLREPLGSMLERRC